MLFILIAALFWFLMKLSKNGYATGITYPVIYEDIPQSKILVGSPTQDITLRISSYGFRLLGYEFKNREPLQINVKRHTRKLEGEKYYWLPNLYREELESQLDGQTSLLRIEPDTVYLTLSEKVKKKVPVRSNVTAAFKPGFEADGPYELMPSMVTVSGPKVYLDSLTEVFTVPKTITDVNKNVSVKIQLRLDNDMISVNPNKVEYKQKVDEFTEKVLTVPVRITNVPKGYSAEIIPKHIKVACKVGLSKARLLESNDIDIVCDFDQLSEFPNRKSLILDVNNIGQIGEIVEISQSSVEFLLIKK